ncbi:formylglycine-generating enzyme family protein [Stenotrophomonas sp. SY1]|uniref:formylglycine-generating enzyme family protein n=1 Tax=Stenotrophomonas sp. SY1 TaxID=477235 RepID=UPI001E59730C|nr:formylglycine-generating enzyme family protein [Stenotrophomonas sp. SY1]MCD9087328.1 SUMF1/EgtB/PvdO family nonheme iron enzyme [Stenotrophomonas sp. SY1]
MAVLLALALAGCGKGPAEPQANAQATPTVQPVEAEPVPAAKASPVLPDPAPRIEVTALPVWTAPEVELQPGELAQARRAADKALAEDRLHKQPDDAIPLYLAILAQQPGDTAARRGLDKARQRLRAQAGALMERTENQRAALAEAAEMAGVAVALAPDGKAERELEQRIANARRLLALNRAGEQALREHQFGEDGGGAQAAFRQVLAADPDNSRARQGLAAIESGLIRRAEHAAASASDFDAAASWLGKAGTIRGEGPTLLDARARIEGIRTAQLDALREGGLRDLSSAKGLKDARLKLEQAERIALPGDRTVPLLRERIALVTHYGSFRPGQVFSDALGDGSRGPQMVVVPHGTFQMGAMSDEIGASDGERPQHPVRFDRGFAMSITEVTVGEFRRFVESTNARPRATRRGHSVVYDERSGNFIRRSGVDWQSDYNGLKAAPNSPVMHVSVRDAEAYAAWLSEQTGRYYRLPSESEFEYALRAGTQGRYPWGRATVPPENTGNFTGSLDVSPSGRHWNNAFIGYGDGFWGTAPVGMFRANAWGLHDMAGNLSEWVADCWHASYRRAPADGAAWYNPGCRQRLIRGGNWANAPEQTRAAWRQSQDSDVTSARIGFRLVRGI